MIAGTKYQRMGCLDCQVAIANSLKVGRHRCAHSPGMLCSVQPLFGPFRVAHSSAAGIQVETGLTLSCRSGDPSERIAVHAFRNKRGCWEASEEQMESSVRQLPRWEVTSDLQSGIASGVNTKGRWTLCDKR